MNLESCEKEEQLKSDFKSTTRFRDEHTPHSKIETIFDSTASSDPKQPHTLASVGQHDVTLEDVYRMEYDTIFLVTNYIQVDLKKVLESVANGTQISLDHAKTLMYNSLNGLNFLHQCGVIHRDIKPENMLMGKNCEVYFCDFGLARLIPKDSEEV